MKYTINYSYSGFNMIDTYDNLKEAVENAVHWLYRGFTVRMADDKGGRYDPWTGNKL